MIKILRYAYALTCTTALLFSGLSHAQNNQPGLAFLRLSMDAAGAASGNAYTASGSGLSALHWNPAGVVQADRHEIVFTHLSGFADMNSDFFGVSWKQKESQAFALSFFSNNIDDIEARSRPTLQPDGTISAHDFYFGLTYSRKLSSSLRIGTTARYMYQKIYLYDATGVSGDIGLQYTHGKGDLTAGAVVRNIGSMNALKTEKPTMPTLARVGAAYALSFPNKNQHVLQISADYETIFEGDNHLYTGCNYGINQKYNIRFGYITGFESGRFSAGGGIFIKRYSFDYAYLPDVTSFSNHHILTFSMIF
ncbi:PorV/PorQ family protein [candidate division KSB1 bacterium]